MPWIPVQEWANEFALTDSSRGEYAGLLSHSIQINLPEGSVFSVHAGLSRVASGSSGPSNTSLAVFGMVDFDHIGDYVLADLTGVPTDKFLRASFIGATPGFVIFVGWVSRGDMRGWGFIQHWQEWDLVNGRLQVVHG